MMGGYGAGMMYGNGLHSSGSSYRPGMMYGYGYNYRTCHHHVRHYFDYGQGMMGPSWHSGDGR